MAEKTKWLKRTAFIVLVTTALVLGPARQAMAYSCGDATYNYSYNTAWLWACGWFSSDPCSDGWVVNACDYVCYMGAQQVTDWVISCQSSEEGPGWWLSWAECKCTQDW